MQLKMTAVRMFFQMAPRGMTVQSERSYAFLQKYRKTFFFFLMSLLLKQTVNLDMKTDLMGIDLSWIALPIYILC